MIDITFNTEDFKSSVLKAVQPQMNHIMEKENKLNEIDGKLIEFEQELKDLEAEYDQIEEIDVCQIDSSQEFDAAVSVLAGKKQKIGVMKDLICRFKNEREKVYKLNQPAKEAFVNALRSAIHEYIVKARLNIAIAVEEILSEDEKCLEAVIELHQKYIIQKGYSTNVPLSDPSVFTRNYFPLSGKRPVLESMVATIRENNSSMA